MKMELNANTNKKPAIDKKQGVRLKTGGVVVAFFFLMYIPSLFHWIFDNKVGTDIIRIGTLENSVNASAVIVRDEELLISPVDGTCIPQFEEGEKIPAFNSVATIVGQSVEDLAAELQEKDIKLQELEKEHRDNLAIFEGDIEKLDDEIGKKLDEVIKSGNSNSMFGIGKLKADIEKLLEKKAEIIAGTGAPESYVSSIKQEKDTLRQMIDSNTREIKSEVSGIVSYVIDGYEEMLRPDALSQITPSLLESIVNAGNPLSDAVIKPVKAEKPFARVIRDIQCYLVAALEPDKAERFDKGDRVEVRINDVGMTMDAEVVYKSELRDGKHIVAVKTNKALSNTSTLRVVNIDLISEYYKGFKVPAESLADLDTNNMTAKLMLVKSGYAVSREVKIIGMDKEYAVVENPEEQEKRVNLYDVYITRPVNIEEGQMITQ